VGQHPLITKLIRGAFHCQSLLPHYTHTWDVLDFLQLLGDNMELSLKHLSWKVTSLLALSRPSRSLDFASLDWSLRVYKPDGVCIYPSALSKQSRQSLQIVHFSFYHWQMIHSYALFQPKKGPSRKAISMFN